MRGLITNIIENKKKKHLFSQTRKKNTQIYSFNQYSNFRATANIGTTETVYDEQILNKKIKK